MEKHLKSKNKPKAKLCIVCTKCGGTVLPLERLKDGVLIKSGLQEPFICFSCYGRTLKEAK